MKNRTNVQSERNGALFLQEAFYEEPRILKAQYEFAINGNYHHRDLINGFIIHTELNRIV